MGTGELEPLIFETLSDWEKDLYIKWLDKYNNCEEELRAREFMPTQSSQQPSRARA
jgi:hypothetical protein